MMSINDGYKLKPLKWYKDLATTRGRRDAGAFIVEGDKAIRQLISSHPEAVIEIVTIEQPAATYGKFPVRTVTENQFRTISSVTTPQGILAVVKMPEDIYTNNVPENAGHRVLLLEDIQDPGNTGTLIRTAAAFNYSGVILSEKCADPFSPKCIQSTAGSILELWLRRTSSYLEQVQSLITRGYFLLAADLNGTEPPANMCLKDNLILALGNEASGLSRAALDLAQVRAKIPIARDRAESLNVAVSGAIFMYLSTRQS
jgi:TrmH family RNA methyltransferase